MGIMEEKEKSIKIAAVQMSSVLGDKQANFEKAEKLIDEALRKDIDLIVLPEVWTIGWKPSLFKEAAEDIKNSPTLEFLGETAKKHNVNIIGGSFITERAGKYYNTCPILNKNGDLVGLYDKMHLFSYYGCDEGTFVDKGKNPVMVDFCPNSREIASVGNDCQSQQSISRNDTVKIGLSICYDIRFPELYRAYAKAGADLLVNVAAWPMKRANHWKALSNARAIENQCFMLALTQSGLIEGKEWNLGQSAIIDFNGEIVSQIEEGEGVFSAELKFNEMYQFRKKCTVLLDIQQNYEVI